MEAWRSRKPRPLPLLSFLLVAVVLLLLLVAPQLASAVPTSRSMQLSHQQQPPSLKLSSMQEMARKQLQGRGRAAARMVVEVNDYPGSGANNRHDPPKAPGRG